MCPWCSAPADHNRRRLGAKPEPLSADALSCFIPSCAARPGAPPPAWRIVCVRACYALPGRPSATASLHVEGLKLCLGLSPPTNTRGCSINVPRRGLSARGRPAGLLRLAAATRSSPSRAAPKDAAGNNRSSVPLPRRCCCRLAEASEAASRTRRRCRSADRCLRPTLGCACDAYLPSAPRASALRRRCPSRGGSALRRGP